MHLRHSCDSRYASFGTRVTRPQFWSSMGCAGRAYSPTPRATRSEMPEPERRRPVSRPTDAELDALAAAVARMLAAWWFARHGDRRIAELQAPRPPGGVRLKG